MTIVDSRKAPTKKQKRRDFGAILYSDDVYAKLSSFRYKSKLNIVSKSVTEVWENDFNFSTY